MDTINRNEPYSALGINPICDVCKKAIVSEDTVMQVFIGTVKISHSEYVVREEVYILTHTGCKQINN